jgi:hypothetical protein
MKCTNCGYVSFDHLSECKKCRTSLTVARDAFGLSAGKPAVPFLLGSLLSDYESPAPLDNIAAKTETHATVGFVQMVDDVFGQEKPENGAEEIALAMVGPDGSEEDFSLLDLSDEELDLLVDKESLESHGMSALLSETDGNGTVKSHPELLSLAEPFPPSFEILLPEEEPSSPAAQTSDVVIQTLDEFSRELESAGLAREEVIQTSDDFPRESESAAQTPDVAIQTLDEFSRGLESAGLAREEVIQIPDDFPRELDSAEPAPDEVVQTHDEFSRELEPAGLTPEEVIQTPDDFSLELESEPKTSPALELAPESTGDPEILEENLEARDEFEPAPQTAPPQPEDPTDDFVIELSENDLETLLEELGSTPKGAA